MSISLSLGAQEQFSPKRTAMDIARKQTEMLVRELGITDSLLHEALFHMHLKYAQMRNISNTRNEAIQRMLQMQEELKQILGPELFDIFMNRQVENDARTPKHTCKWITAPNTDSLSATNAAEQTPTTPPKHQP